jgi:antitoxin PrlF
MCITPEGKITIPAETREEIGPHEGCEVDSVVEGDFVRLVRARDSESCGQSMARRLRGQGGASGMTTDELMVLLRGED